MAPSTNPFRYFESSPEVIRLVVMMHVKYPLSLRNVEELLCERRIDICHETVRLCWNRFGPMFAGEIRRKRVDRMRAHTHWKGTDTLSRCGGENPLPTLLLRPRPSLSPKPDGPRPGTGEGSVGGLYVAGC
jgi:hypothetical protein